MPTFEKFKQDLQSLTDKANTWRKETLIPGVASTAKTYHADMQQLEAKWITPLDKAITTRFNDIYDSDEDTVNFAETMLASLTDKYSPSIAKAPLTKPFTWLANTIVQAAYALSALGVTPKEGFEKGYAPLEVALVTGVLFACHLAQAIASPLLAAMSAVNVVASALYTTGKLAIVNPVIAAYKWASEKCCQKKEDAADNQEDLSPRRPAQANINDGTGKPGNPFASAAAEQQPGDREMVSEISMGAYAPLPMDTHASSGSESEVDEAPSSVTQLNPSLRRSPSLSASQ